MVYLMAVFDMELIEMNNAKEVIEVKGPPTESKATTGKVANMVVSNIASANKAIILEEEETAINNLKVASIYHSQL